MRRLDLIATEEGSQPSDSGPTRESPAIRFADGRYQVRRVLGEGGQKRVYLAHDLRLDRDVVISVVKTGRLDEDSITRLTREARALARLGDHPHIVTVHDIGEDFGQPYIVTQYVDGGSLDSFRRSKSQDGQRLPVDEALRIGRELCDALGHAHDRGIVHRDLKPGNVWLTHDGAVKLGDFGLAVGFDLSQITEEGVLLGTVAYMAPEQALGRRAEPRSDLYSLGVVLYELVTGRLPFAGDTLAAILSQHLHSAPVAPSVHRRDLSPAMDRLILALLAKTPEDRPASADVVRQSLAAISTTDTKTNPSADITSLNRLAVGVFVGRSEELQQLRNGFDSALTGHGRLLLVVGEPGSGKTSTVEQLLTYARIRGAQVLRAHCYEGEGAPAYWPWVLLLRDYITGRSPGELLSVMGPGAPAIAQLDADIARHLPELASGLALEPEQARFRLFDSITAFLKNASKERALVIFIDDLHWADAASLLLLRFLARELPRTRLLVIGTYRDLAFRPQHPFAQAMGALAAQGLDHRIHLHGLTETDVARFIEMAAGFDPPEHLVRAVYKETEGNPFFVKEVVSLLVATGQLQRVTESANWNISLPQGVREVVTRRVAQLSAEGSGALAVASVMGRDFELEALEKVSELDPDRLVDAIDEAVAARLITSPEGDHESGRYRFSHALIRETLYEGLSDTKRARLHRLIGEVMEQHYASRLDRHLGALAHHFLKAGRFAQLDKAIDYAVRAAERADALLAYEDGVDHYRAALDGLARKEPPDPARRCELLLALGEVQTKAGLTAEARESFTQASSLARELALPELLARAALGLGAGTAARTRLGQAIDEFQIRLLREALDRAGGTETALHARLLAQLALALYHAPEERSVLSQRAVDIARRVGDEGALRAALYSLCVSLEGFNKAAERLRLASELVERAESAGDTEMALRGHFRCFRELMELRDIEGGEREIASYARLAEQLRQPRYLWYVPYCRASLASFRGQFQQADALIRESLAVGRRAQDPNCTLFCSVLTYSSMYSRGAFEEIERMLKGMIEKYPSTSNAWRLQLTRVYCHTDRLDEARREFGPLAARDFDDLPVDGSFVTTLAGLCTISWYLGDRRVAEKSFQRLEPYAGMNAIAGNTGVIGGAVTTALAAAAAAMGRWDDAERFFLKAIEEDTEMGARNWLLWAEGSYLRMLVLSGRPGDREKAAGRLPRARAMAREVGMGWLIAAVDDLLTRSQS